jgi:CRISPR-associated exonuclease Cas4
MAVERTVLGGEESMVAISALQHFLFCQRQCGLIHLEQVWSENAYTAEGRIMHERAHDGPAESRGTVRTLRGVSLVCLRLGISGQGDVVEFHKDGRVIPVEYKRGKPKAHRADEVQVCAQAFCLEEMLGREVRVGYLYYGQQKRRVEVLLDASLRTLTEATVAGVKEMLRSQRTPSSEYAADRCDACSLLDICQPKALRFRRGVAAWLLRELHTTTPVE